MFSHLEVLEGTCLERQLFPVKTGHLEGLRPWTANANLLDRQASRLNNFDKSLPPFGRHGAENLVIVTAA